MIYYATIDPSAISADEIVKRNAEGQALALLRAIEENVMVISDSSGVLKAALQRMAQTMSARASRGQMISIVAGEILKNQKGRFHPCPRLRLGGIDHIRDAVKSLNLDTVVTTAEGVNHIGPPSTALEGYDLSEFERRRRESLIAHETVDDIGKDEFCALLRRCSRFSEDITIVDKYIGRSDDVERFGDGLELVVSNWLSGKDPSIAARSFSIYTAPLYDIKPGMSARELSQKQAENQKRRDLVRRKIFSRICDLCCGSGVTVGLYFKEDCTGKKLLHDRYLGTKAAVFKLGAGFDFFSASGELCCQSFVITDLHGHLRKIKMLPDALEPLAKRAK